jgi:hypothetical protein
MNNIGRKSVIRHSTWAAALLVIGLLLSQPDHLMAQVTGSGTANQIPKWSGATALTNSVMAENSGRIGLGTTNPVAELEVVGRIRAIGTIAQLSFTDRSGSRDWAWYGTGDVARLFATGVGDLIGITPSGNVGIGTVSPAYKLQLIGGRQWISPTAETYALGLSRTDISGAFWLGASNSVFNPDLILSSYAGIERVRVTDSGRMGIGTSSPSSQLHVVGDVTLTGSGNITATGTIQGNNVKANYQDVAEWVPASRAIPAGTVVVLDTDQNNHVLPSSRSYDTRVAGVVSANPGVILGEGGNGKVMVATTGRVKVKVDATRAPIRVGDLLVTSDKEGIAMRSQPLDLGGTPIHRPGTLIGKALEPLEKGIGEILVLLSLQ